MAQNAFLILPMQFSELCSGSALMFFILFREAADK